MLLTTVSVLTYAMVVGMMDAEGFFLGGSEEPIDFPTTNKNVFISLQRDFCLIYEDPERTWSVHGNPRDRDYSKRETIDRCTVKEFKTNENFNSRVVP